MVIWYASDDYPSSSTSTKQHAANCVIIGAVDSRAIGLVADWQCGARGTVLEACVHSEVSRHAWIGFA